MVFPIIILIQIGLLYNKGLMYFLAVRGIVSVSNIYESKQISRYLLIIYNSTQQHT